MDVPGVFLSATSSVYVLGVSTPPAVWKCRVSFHYQQYEHAGCLSITNSLDVYAFPPSYNFCKCRIARLSGIRSVRYPTGIRMQMPEPVRYRNAPAPDGISLDADAQLCQLHNAVLCRVTRHLKIRQGTIFMQNFTLNWLCVIQTFFCLVLQII